MISSRLQNLLMVNNFFRSISLNLSLLYSASLFISQLGSKSYSGIFFISTLTVIAVYVLIILQKELRSYMTYMGVTCFLLIVSILQDAFASSSELIFSYAVMVLAVDVISGTINGNLIQSLVPNNYFSWVFQKQMTIDLVSKIIAAVSIWSAVEFNCLGFVPLFVWAFLALHIVLFSFITRKNILADRRSLSARRKIRDFVDSVVFVKANPLVRSVVVLISWAFAAKFLVENIFYSGLNSEYGSIEEVSSIISIASFSTIVCSLLFQRVNYRFFSLKPSTLLSVLPIGILSLLIVTTIYGGILSYIMMFLFFRVFNTGLQVPITRRCLIPLPDSRKKNIVTLTFLVASASSLVISGFISVFKQYLNLTDYSILLVVCTVPVFFILADFDRHYIGNLWNQFKETVNKEWSMSYWLAPYSRVKRRRMDLQSEKAITYNISGLDQDVKDEVEGIIFGYQSFENEVLKEAVENHYRLLHHTDPVRVIQGIRIIGDLSIVQLFPILIKLKNSENEEISKAAVKELYIDDIYKGFDTKGLRCHSKRKVKSILRQNLGRGYDELIVTKMSQLLSLDFKKTVAKFIEILERYDYEGSRSLWECIDKYGIDLQPFLRAMTSRSYDKASEYRSVLQHLDLRTTVLLAGRDLINEFTSKLMRGRFSFWNATGEEGSTNLVQVFQHTLFLQLFYMRSDPSFDLVLDSIKDISKADDDQKAVLKQVHMTALSGSYNERLWRYFYTRMPAT